MKESSRFTTRDLLLMAALAALGGVASTYVNALGDVVQSFLGFAGGTQWAAGLHVLWIVLAAALTGKVGAGTATGLFKGGVELLSGNTHGLLVVLIDLVAGVLVDLAFLPFRRRDSLVAYSLAGGLSAASNVLVFQVFAALPADLLAYGALLLVAVVAGVSGVLFGGLLGRWLVGALRRAGVVRDQPPVTLGRTGRLLFALCAVLVTVGVGAYLYSALRGPAAIQVDGVVAAPYAYPTRNGDLSPIKAQATLRNVTSTYRGVAVRELVARAQPSADAGLLLITGSDGYAFFVSLNEVKTNGSLLLAASGSGKSAAYDLVGPQNAKAWVRGVARLTVIGVASLPITGALHESSSFDPDRWQYDMDSTRLDVGFGAHKYQGVPLGKVLQALVPQPGAAEVVAVPAPDSPDVAAGMVTLPLSRALTDGDLRLFTVFQGQSMQYALATMDGQVLVARLQSLQVR
jgi:ABC-type thiamin/hydroxymethylpyrimidine transport system permease subunit